jgi:DNA replication protein DnaC
LEGVVAIVPAPFVENYVPGANLYLTGARGKSVRAAQLLVEAVSTLQLSGRWLQADTYIEALKDSFSTPDGLLGDEYSTPYLIKNVQGVYDVLVLDGLGDERMTDFAKHEIGNLIRTRYDRMKSTIITSRLSIGDIANRYGDRLADPLSEFMMEVVR